MEKQPIYTLRLKKLNCYLSDEGDADEVFLKHEGKKLWPKDGKYVEMKESSEDLKMDLKIQKGSRTTIELWDYDRWSPNDLLGTFTIVADQSGGPFTTEMVKKDSKSHYSLEWELH